MLDPRLIKQAKLLVNYSCAVKPNDFVFVSCPEAGKPWAVEVVKQACLAGAHVEYILTSEDVDEARLKHATENHFNKGDHLFEAMLSRATVWFRAFCGENTRFGSNIPTHKIKSELQARLAWKSIFRDRYGNGSLRWSVSQFPTVSYAQEASMSLSEYEDFVYQAMLLDFDDPAAEWKKLSREQDGLVNILNSKKKFRVIAEGTDITIGTSGRKWINSDGKINMPDGELTTGPVEHDVNGVITFSFPGIFEGREIEGIRFEAKDGKIVKATAQRGEDLLLALLNTDAGSMYFGEFAIGTNYGIKKFTKNILFDEKIGGTIHMAIGTGYAETGSKNRSSIHWDLVCDLRSGGEIYADDELIFKEGKLLL